MATEFIQSLTLESTLAELPGYGAQLEVRHRGKEIGALFDRHPELPGVVIVDQGRVRKVVSRGQYLRLVGRGFGREVYDPRPIQLMLDSLKAEESPLIFDSSLGIQPAAARALGRPTELMYEPIVVRSGGETGSEPPVVVDFPDLLRADSRISALRRRQMAQILGTVEEGFLMVGSDRRIAGEYSSSTERLFQTERIAGLTLPDFLRPMLGDEAADLCHEYLGTLFNPNVIERLVVDINPLVQVPARLAGGELKHLRFRFVRSVEDGRIQQILVKVEDISRQVEAAEDREAEERRTRERMDLVFEIIGADPERVAQLAERLGREVSPIEQALDPSLGHDRSVAERLDPVARRLHGLKGEAGVVGLKSLQQRLHRLEDLVEEGRQASSTKEALARVGSAAEELRRIRDELGSALDQLKTLSAINGTQAPEPRSDAPARTPANTPAPTPAPSRPGPASPPSLLDESARLTEELADRLQRPARFFSRLREDQVPDEHRQLLRDVIPQLVRNSMVHGVETEAERLGAGKPGIATLQLALREHPERRQWEWIYQDDGRGLDLDTLRRRARALGLDTESPAALPRGPEDIIFLPGLSTAPRPDLDAGRGMGMDMVRHALRQAGGDIFPHTKAGAYCAFQILLPMGRSES